LRFLLLESSGFGTGFGGSVLHPIVKGLFWREAKPYFLRVCCAAPNTKNLD
jgi:hypothetical protein